MLTKQKIVGKKLKINEWSIQDRPREKLINNGTRSLSDAELLAILIGSGTPEDNAVFSKIKKYLIENPDSTKTQFIKMFVQKSDFDEVAEYLLKIQPILRNRTPTQEEIELLKPYDEIRTIIENLQEEK